MAAGTPDCLRLSSFWYPPGPRVTATTKKVAIESLERGAGVQPRQGGCGGKPHWSQVKIFQGSASDSPRFVVKLQDDENRTVPLRKPLSRPRAPPPASTTNGRGDRRPPARPDPSPDPQP